MRRPPQRGYWRNVLRRFRRDRVGLVCLIILLAIALAAIFAPLLAPADPYKTSMIRRLIAPGERGYLLGTDELGRDMVSRLLYGGRVSLSMGIAPIVLATMIGGGLGVIAGYFGRHVNMIIMRVIDVFYAFPSVLLAVAMAGVLGSGILNSLISLTLVFIPPIARVAESVTTQMRNQDFVEAARATGAGSTRIIIEHVLANVTGPILTYASSLVSVSIIIASGLSFPGARRVAADRGLGSDAQHAAPGRLCRTGQRSPSGRDDLSDVRQLQPRQRQPAHSHGRPRMNPVDPRDRGGPRQPLLTVEGLRKYFPLRNALGTVSAHVQAVDDVSFAVAKGETLGVVGESGCGKSTTARLLMHLIERDAGSLLLDGDPVGSGGVSVRDLRRQVQMVFQDSYASLNPRHTAAAEIAFGLRVIGHRRGEAEAQARQTLRAGRS